MRIKAIPFATLSAALLALAVSAPSALRAEMSSTDRAMARERAEIRNGGDMAFQPLEKKPKRKEAGFLFHRASKIPPTDQFAAAAALEDAGRRSEACKAYDRLVRSFPYSAAASQAQLRLGRLLEKQGKYKKAYEEYLYMLYFYPENAPADSLLRQMYAIANYYRTRARRAAPSTTSNASPRSPRNGSTRRRSSSRSALSTSRTRTTTTPPTPSTP